MKHTLLPTSALALTFVCLLSSTASSQWVGEWKLDETSGTTASDFSNSKNDGKLNNFASNPWGPARFGNGLTFDGVDDFVETDGSKTVFDGKGAPFSISYWLKAAPQIDRRVYSEGNQVAGTGQGALFTIGSGRGADVDKVWVWGRNNANRVQFGIASNTVVYDDTWHHVAVVHVSGEFQIYVDGTLDRTGNYAAGSATFGTFTMDRVGLGAVLRNAACCLFTGALDDVRIYSFAMSAADVAQVAQGIPLLPCRASVGTFGLGCNGSMTLTATGTPAFGQRLALQLRNGPANVPALLLASPLVDPTDLSLFGFAGCFAYPSLSVSLLTSAGTLDSAGSSALLGGTIPNNPADACTTVALQGIALNGANLALSPAVVLQIGN